MFCFFMVAEQQTTMTQSDAGHFYVVTSTGSGHLYPCLELCHLLSSQNYTATLVLPANLLSLVPPSFHHHPRLRTAVVADFHHGPPTPENDETRRQAGLNLEANLASGQHPLAAVVDFQVAWTKSIFWKFDVPVISFFTFGACATAMEWSAWKAGAADLSPGEARTIQGLPEEMRIRFTNLGRTRGGGPRPGQCPPWVSLIEGSVGLMFNTCQDLERPFFDYLADQLGLPVWGVGPLLPEQYWKSSVGSLILDHKIWQMDHERGCTEEEVVQWLNSKPCGSVLYVSFGSAVARSSEENARLASALEDSTRPFIWVIQPGSSTPGCEVGNRGLIIKGWAPQLLILSHPSIGGFLSHCGWNSTMEAICRGVPFLAWPIRGDQLYNAKLVVNYLKIGYMVLPVDLLEVTKTEILEKIERLMGDKVVLRRAETIRKMFDCGFPKSAESALNGFKDYISHRAT